MGFQICWADLILVEWFYVCAGQFCGQLTQSSALPTLDTCVCHITYNSKNISVHNTNHSPNKNVQQTCVHENVQNDLGGAHTKMKNVV